MTLYLDNAASSHPKPEQVYQAADDALRNIGANPGRSGHKLAVRASQKIARTRELLSRLFEIRDPNRIVFTANATEAINLGLKGFLNPGDHVITSSMEHNSVVRPLRFLETQGVELTFVPCTPFGQMDTRTLEKAIRKNTRLIVLTHASNVTGGLMPIGKAADLAHKNGAWLMVDAAQTAGLIPISVADIGIDLLAAPGHKGLWGPQGTGFLFIGPDISLRPLKEGGTGSQSEMEFQPDFLPDCMESGTMNTPGIAGLGAGVEFLLHQGLASIRAREMSLGRMIWNTLKQNHKIKLYGPEQEEDRTSNIS
ncbi:MAG: aminotransferase class V-fold PLP-dependent enzyme, partial [Deltaproteobacteria bacterium]|nr:aminotransferase class V-fold PLP-dependent enzyme [Deltaproteobacteria bacterium]